MFGRKGAEHDPKEILDFGVSTNPFMPPPDIREEISSISFTEYPDSEATELRGELSKCLGISTENLIIGSGTTELIRLIALTYFQQGDKVLLLEPTYGEYETACRIAGVRLIRQHAREKDNYFHIYGRDSHILDFGLLISDIHIWISDLGLGDVVMNSRSCSSLKRFHQKIFFHGNHIPQCNFI